MKKQFNKKGTSFKLEGDVRNTVITINGNQKVTGKIGESAGVIFFDEEVEIDGQKVKGVKMPDDIASEIQEEEMKKYEERMNKINKEKPEFKEALSTGKKVLVNQWEFVGYTIYEFATPELNYETERINHH